MIRCLSCSRELLDEYDSQVCMACAHESPDTRVRSSWRVILARLGVLRRNNLSARAAVAAVPQALPLSSSGHSADAREL